MGWQQGRHFKLYRGSSGRRDDADGSEEGGWQQRLDGFSPDRTEEYEKYPMVTADQLRARRERPRRVKMLTRDFIEGVQALLTGHA